MNENTDDQTLGADFFGESEETEEADSFEGWTSGVRDVTELPSVEFTFAESEPVAEIGFDKKHLEGFTKLEGVAWNDYDKQKQASGLAISDERIRTYRKLYQTLGLIRRDTESETIRLTPLGEQIKSLNASEIEKRFSRAVDNERQQIYGDIRKTAVSILSKYQLKNPFDGTGFPDDCDVQPAICVWKAMLNLEGKLHHEELNRVLMHVRRMDEIDSAIKRIREAREKSVDYRDDTEATRHLGKRVINDQPSARTSAWFSFLGWGGIIIETKNDSDGFRNLVPEAVPFIEKAVANPPEFFETDDVEEWFNYYLSEAEAENEIEEESPETGDLISQFSDDLAAAGLTYETRFIKRFVASCQTKPFVILTGLSGSGKTKLAQAFARWLTPISKSQADPFQIGAEIRGDRTVYRVINANKLSVELTGSEAGEESGRVLLARELIHEWVKCIKENNFTRATIWQDIRNSVKNNSSYVYRQHGTGVPLKAAAFAVLESDEPESPVKHYELVAVGPDWTSKDSVLGYADALDAERYIKTQTLDLILRAEQYPAIPHFLIFDEMNLSHVERYFADILSALESDEPIWLHNGDADKDGIPPKIDTLPKNLFIIGTVNVDETTYMFSPKVLDRANVIEFRVNSKEMGDFLQNPNQIKLSELDGKGSQFAKAFVRQINSVPELVESETKIVKAEIMTFFGLMEGFNTEFGYRNAREIIRFVSFYKSLETENWNIKDAVDAQIFQKLLPKLNGSRQKIGPVLNALAAICFEKHEWNDQGEFTNSTHLLSKARDSAKSKTGSFDALQRNDEGDYTNDVKDAFYPLSFAKIRRMLEALDQGFTSFTEA